MSPGNRFFFCCLIFILTFSFLWGKYHRLLTDTAVFGGDEWEYQTLGVNLAYGHGYQEGRLEDFSVYQYNTSENYHLYHDPLTGEQLPYKDFFMKGGFFSFYRTPGYPFFLAGVYKIFGVHPGIVKILQLGLVALVAALLPVLGWWCWGYRGWISGIISAFLFVGWFSPNPMEIMTEPLITSALLVWVFLLIFWENNLSGWRIFSLGIFSAALILIKGLNIFIPPLFLVYLFWRFRPPGKKVIFQSAVFLAGLFLLLGPWSWYASQKSGRPVFLSTHSNTLLLDSNNENSINDGDWHPQWRKNLRHEKNYFYFSLKNSGYSAARKTGLFFWKYKKHVPRLLFNKFRRGFLLNPGVLAATLLTLVYYGVFMAGRLPAREKLQEWPLFYLANIFFITLVFYGRYLFVLPFLPFFILTAVDTVFCLVQFSGRNK